MYSSWNKRALAVLLAGLLALNGGGSVRALAAEREGAVREWDAWMEEDTEPLWEDSGTEQKAQTDVKAAGEEKAVKAIELASDKKLYHAYEMGGSSSYSPDYFIADGKRRGQIKILYEDGTTDYVYDTNKQVQIEYGEVQKDERGNWLPGTYKGYVRCGLASAAFDIEVFRIAEKGKKMEQGKTDVFRMDGNEYEKYGCFTVSESGRYCLDFSSVEGGSASWRIKGGAWNHVGAEMSFQGSRIAFVTLAADTQYFFELNGREEGYTAAVTIDLIERMQEELERNRESLIPEKGLYRYTPEASGYYALELSGADGQKPQGWCYVGEKKRYELLQGLQFYMEAGETYTFKLIVGNERERLTLKQIRQAQENGAFAAGRSQEGISWRLDTAGILDIRGSGVVHTGGWNVLSEEVKGVVFGEGITEIGEKLFSGYKIRWNYLTSITFPQSLVKIGETAFYQTNAPAVTIPRNVEIIEERAFALSKLERVTFEEGSKLKRIGIRVFLDTLLSEIELPSSLQYLGAGALSSKNLSKITYQGTSLAYCGRDAFGQNTFYPLGEWNLWYKAQPDCVILGNALAKYKGSEKEIAVPDAVTVIGVHAFNGNQTLEKITLPQSTGTILEYGFAWCKALKQMTVPGSVSKVAYRAFSGCTALEEVVIGEGVTELEYGLFSGCDNLKKVTIPRSVTAITEGEKEEEKGLGTAEGTVICCYENSAAHLYAQKNNLKYQLIGVEGDAGQGGGNGGSQPGGGTPGNPGGGTDGGNGGSTGGTPDNAGGNGSAGGTSKPAKGKVSRITINAPTKQLAAGRKITLKAAVSPKNAANPKVTWKSSNTKYATVNSKGVVTAKKAGAGKTVTITATAKDKGGAKASVKIKIMKNAVTGVKIQNAPKTLKAGKSVKLKAVVKTNGKKANKTVKWTSSNEKYAAVNAKGKVKAKKAGKGKTVTITATSTDGTKETAKVKIRIK